MADIEGPFATLTNFDIEPVVGASVPWPRGVFVKLEISPGTSVSFLIEPETAFQMGDRLLEEARNAVAPEG